MKNLFAPFSLALLANQKGFTTQDFFATWNIDEQHFYPAYSKSVVEESKHLIIAPLYCQLVDWFREVQGFEISSPETFVVDEHNQSYRCEIVCVRERGHANIVLELSGFRGYYELLTTALEEAFKLI